MGVVNRNLKRIIIFLLVLIEIGAIFLAYKSFDNKDKIKKVNLTESNNSLFAIMVEQEDGTFKEESSWPGSDYIYEESMSGCVDSSGKKIEDSLIYDPETNTVTLETEYTTHCYLYFKAPEQKYFEGVRYIKDCIYGNNKNEYNTWVEIQALKDGTNVALNKSVIATDKYSSSFDNLLNYATDGNTSISESSITATYSSSGSGTNSVRSASFNTSNVVNGDIIYFEFLLKTYEVYLNMASEILYSSEVEGSGGLTTERKLDNYYIYGDFDVTSEIISDNNILLEVASDSPSGSLSPILMVRNPNYLISRNTSCVTVDLGETYDLDEIKVWHYYKDGRSYNNHTLSTSSDNSTWTKIIDNQSGVTETSEGISVLPE